jgi:hypothetical protein
MFRREGRLGHPELEAEPHGHVTRRIAPLHNWERTALLLVAIALLVFGAIYGLNWITALFG